MKRWMKIILIILGLPKSIWINYRSLPFCQALRLPILVSPLTKIVSTKGKIVIDGRIYLGMITFGLSGYGLAVSDKCVIQNNGTIHFKGRVHLGGGTRLSVAGGYLIFGTNCIFTGDCSIICKKEISFGKDCLIAFNTQFMDADLHYIKNQKGVINNEQNVFIGDHVWICSNVNVMKGAFLPSDSVIGTQSLIHKRFVEEKCIIAGNPARIVKKDITWSL